MLAGNWKDDAYISLRGNQNRTGIDIFSILPFSLATIMISYEDED